MSKLDTSIAVGMIVNRHALKFDPFT